ncbi:SGNH/GDSL hydrolase family protein [Terriglobus tenax]|uniref:SGNH/GDSL hydrolase family protein n=1 Tax=Terriglobus tenax TaxID=1111115 RepID=UPI0021DFACD3|nr:GDSL-type esterase/lipase family protein [Terriglobus tenax]
MRNCVVFLLLSVTALAHGQIRVINSGWPGRNTAQIEEHLEHELVAVKPDFVVILAGGNDALNEKAFLPPAQTQQSLTKMVQRAEKSGAQVIMVTVHDPDLARLMTRHTPESYGSISPLERQAQVNRIVQQVARENHATLVPFNQVLRDAGGANAELSTDGVHLTARGYGLLAGAVRSALPKSLPANTTILCLGDSLTYGIGVRVQDTPETPDTYPSQLRALLR